MNPIAAPQIETKPLAAATPGAQREGNSDLSASFRVLEELYLAEEAAGQKVSALLDHSDEAIIADADAASRSATDDFCAQATRIRAMQPESFKDIALQFICLASVEDLEPSIRELVARLADFAGIKTILPFDEDFLATNVMSSSSRSTFECIHSSEN